MSYASGEAAVLSILRLHADYNDRNTSRGNWKILDSGAAANYAVLRMGAATNEAHTTTSAMTTWATEIMVYRRYIDDGPSAISLQGDVQTLVEHIEKYPTLQNLVTDAQVTTIGAMENIRMEAGGPMWLRTIISLQWQEERDIIYV